ncbi:sce7726 family protein [Vibrio gazogenes]|uniref:Sce7726 family protein n=1 Tax=Vibrio gazogenes DSM 21264 = NBRC 103151 TaxID=1123492 RepID=A0A1M5FT63_VIBGA|nr:sce7726 family protein [Vibrio gazogenes]USP13540.1 sce7726 family protein [Vibrio gazogenes]SHF94688.1 hypothetical protein SAMN02745781_03574 [Vibrio gazogenes DSM 21264] [Vibrio gazogenes DSM 21264 = NBRC 103151]SJN54856.1 hypothetical protein BQ6471_01243 [Vibrio gazogenes]
MRLKDAARIFSSGYLRKLADGDYSLICRVIDELDLPNNSLTTLKDVYENVYQLLNLHYRFEYYYKNTIVNKVLLGRHSLNTAVMLSELRIGRNIADCVILNGQSTCYEIKTEYDSLDRLSEQLSSYYSIFDNVYVVCGEKHLDKILKQSPDEVGVIQLTKRNTLSTVRQAKDLSKNDIDKNLMLNTLRSEEYKHLAKLISGSIPSVSNIKMYSACFDIISTTDAKILREHFKTVLKYHRKNNGNFIRSLPKSLKNAGVSYKLPIRTQQQLVDILNSNLSKDNICITPYSEANSLN